jgi:cytochrome c556
MRGLLALAVAGAALGAAATAAEESPAVPQTAAQAVAARQSAYLLSAATFGGMKGAIDRGDDVKSQAFASRALARWARTLPSMFPEGSGVEPSEALPNVWSDRAGFEARAADYAAAAAKLAELAQAGDQPGFAAQWGVVRQTCSACHDVYRKPQPPRG